MSRTINERLSTFCGPLVDGVRLAGLQIDTGPRSFEQVFLTPDECAELVDVLEKFADLSLRRAVDALHPTGRCTCAGEGRCAWCKAHCDLCGASRPCTTHRRRQRKSTRK